MVEAELKCKLEDVFSEFEEKAIAAATLAQVHRAILKENAQQVAVKVQFPQLATQVLIDLQLV